MGLSRDGVRLHVSSFSGDGVSGGVVNLIVDDVDALHAEPVAKRVAIDVTSGLPRVTRFRPMPLRSKFVTSIDTPAAVVSFGHLRFRPACVVSSTQAPLALGNFALSYSLPIWLGTCLWKNQLN